MNFLQDLENQFIKVENNKITFTVQDGAVPKVGVNGLQVMDMIVALKNIFWRNKKIAT